MVKTKIVETTEKYDKDGNLVEKITREENTEDDTDYTDNGNMLLNGENLLVGGTKNVVKAMPQGISVWY